MACPLAGICEVSGSTRYERLPPIGETFGGPSRGRPRLIVFTGSGAGGEEVRVVVSEFVKSEF